MYPKARESLADQLRIGKEVTRKVKKSDDESDEEIPITQPEKSDNPWLGGLESTRASTEVTSGYRKLWNNVNEGKQARVSMNKEVTSTVNQPKAFQEAGARENDEDDPLSAFEIDEEEVQTCVSECEGMEEQHSEMLDEGLTRKSTMEDFDQSSEVVETKRKSRRKKARKGSEEKVSIITEMQKGKRTPTDIDPSKFILMKDAMILNSSVPVTEEGNEEDEGDEEEEQRRMTLAEAFADDDVIEQFKEEKKRIVNAATPKDIDLTLPGWGEWGGAGVKISNRKKKRFIIKAPPAPKRRDDNQGNLIINEDKNATMRRQQVSVHIFIVMAGLPQLYLNCRLMICHSHSARRQHSNLLFEHQ